MPDMIRHGWIRGIFLHMNWDDYENDWLNNSHQGLMVALTQINALVQSSPFPVNITVGLAAGDNTPCRIFKHYQPYGYSSMAAGDFVTNPDTKQHCYPIPMLYNSQQDNKGTYFAQQYVAAVTDAVNAVTSFFSSPGRFTKGSVTAIKISGLNTDNIETHIAGDNNNLIAQTVGSKACYSGEPVSFTCKSKDAQGNKQTPAKSWLNDYGYYPLGVEQTWNAITGASGLAGLAANTPPTRPLLELDGLDGNDFPPITASGNSQTTQPSDFTCYAPDPLDARTPKCKVPAGPDDPGPNSDGIQFLELVLFPDLLNSTVPSATVGVQLDGLAKDNPETAQVAAANHHVIPLNCWTHHQQWTETEPSGPTVIGFQSATNQLPNSDEPSASAYLEGLQWGVQFAAAYEELWPSDLNQYLHIGALFNQLSTYQGAISLVQSNLINNASNPPPSNNCSYTQ